MVDFKKLMEEKRAAAPIEKRALTHLERVNHLLEYHLQECSERDVTFLYSVRIWLQKPAHEVYGPNQASEKQLKWITDLEDRFCGSICHALNDAGIAHD